MNQPQTPEHTVRSASTEPQGEAGSVILFNLRTLAHFQDEGPFVQIVSDLGAARLVLFAFKAGQQLKEHHTSSQILIQVLRGHVVVTTPGNSTRLRSGMVLQIEANVPHSVTAPTEAMMLLTMTPSPTYHSLQKEVFEHLTPLVSRHQASSVQ